MQNGATHNCKIKRVDINIDRSLPYGRVESYVPIVVPIPLLFPAAYVERLLFRNPCVSGLIAGIKFFLPPPPPGAPGMRLMTFDTAFVIFSSGSFSESRL